MLPQFEFNWSKKQITFYNKNAYNHVALSVENKLYLHCSSTIH